MPEKLPLGVDLIEPTSPTRSARHEVGTCVSDTRQTNRRRRVISTTSDCTPQQWRTRVCQILPPPRSLAPFDLRNLRPLGLLKTTAIPLRSPRTSDPAPRRDLALTGVSAPKNAPRSTSTTALHRARPMRGRDAENEAPEKPPGADDGGQGHTTTRLRTRPFDRHYFRSRPVSL